MVLQKEHLEWNGAITTRGCTMTKQAIQHFAIFVWEQYQKENYWQVPNVNVHLLVVDIDTGKKPPPLLYKKHQARHATEEPSKLLCYLNRFMVT